MHGIVFGVLALCLSALASCTAQAAGISIESPRRAFYRGEEIRLSVKYTSPSPVRNGVVAANLGDVVKASAQVGSISAGAEGSSILRLPTAGIKSGDYTLRVALVSGSTVITSIEEKVSIRPKPNPEGLMVWLWGGGGNEWYVKHGFTSWGGPTWTQNARDAKVCENLDNALRWGASCSIHPNGGLREIDVKNAPDPDMAYQGLYRPENVANPFHPEVARIQNEANRKLMEAVKDFPQAQTAFFNTEIVDNMVLNKNKAGLQLTKDVLGFTEEEVGEPKFVAPGVLADDDRKYQLHRFAFKEGKGLVTANKRTVDMISRYRPDIITFTDPYREVCLLDLFPGVDVIETWTYTNPDPKLMLYAETLRAAAKPTGQLWCNTVTMLNYPGELDPSDEWLLMGPGRTTVTSWINLSRAPKIVGYYYSSECPPIDTDTYKTPYATSQVIKALSDNVYKPYGPMITNLEVEPRKIAVLSSDAARLHGKSPRLIGWYDNMQIYCLYTVMAMAHLQADVIFDEHVERYGLDDYDVLVLPKCDVLTKTVYDKVMEFRKRGGTVIADQYLGPEIPGAIKFDFDFTYREKVTANAIVKNRIYADWNDQLQPGSAELKTVEGVTALDDQKIMESYAASLKEGLKGKVEPEVDCDEPTVLFNMLERDGVKYLVVINDKRTYDDRLGQYKSVLGKMLPQTVTVRLRKWDQPALFAYDMLQRKSLPLKKASGGYEFTVDLGELGGKIIALYPKKMGGVAVKSPKTAGQGVPFNITVSVNDAEGAPLNGLQPVQVIITDPKGNKNEYSDYYCAKNGVLSIPFLPAANDEKGKWKITALDLTSGMQAVGEFNLVK